jgi:uncharacterized protein YndB with AHSA1/START domain
MVMERLRTDTTYVYSDGSDLVYERTFDAPRALLWAVLTDPERIPRWWGKRDQVTTVVEMDVRVGGRWRFIIRIGDGSDVPFAGEYLEIDPPRFWKQTFAVDLEGLRDQVGVETFTLEEVDGKTKLTARSVFGSVEEMEAAMSTGMIDGAIESWDRLEEVLAEG